MEWRRDGKGENDCVEVNFSYGPNLFLTLMSSCGVYKPSVHTMQYSFFQFCAGHGLVQAEKEMH